MNASERQVAPPGDGDEHRGFWQMRWDEGRIGFHRTAPNDHLVRFFEPALGDAPRGRVLVPLCGKSLDLTWLEAHFDEVVGVEFVRRAAIDYAEERGLPYEVVDHGGFEAVRSGRVTILVRDFFALSPEEHGLFDAAYDRAALIALPPAVRGPYVDQLARLLAPGGRALVLSFDYPQALHPGPPFAVPDAEADALFAPHGALTPLARERVDDVPVALAGAVVTTSAFRFVRGPRPAPAPFAPEPPMTTITFKGQPLETSGALPAVGAHAPAFTLVRPDLTELRLADLAGKVKVLNIFPSLDTSVCALSVRRFNAAAAEHPEVAVVNISADLPFAHRRFCTSEGIDRAVNASTFRSTFATDYGVLMTSGPLAGLASRAVLVLDGADRVVYAQQVPEIAQEPDYDAALAAVGTAGQT